MHRLETTTEPGAPVRRFSDLPATVRALWAKSGDPLGHGLLAHLLDVAAVAEAILLREPPTTRRMAAQALGLDETQVVRWVAALAGLHDLGKATPGFQAKWAAGQAVDAAAGLRFEPAAALRCDQHSLATQALLTPLLCELSGAELDWCRHVVQAVSAHHGFHFTEAQVAAAGTPPYERGEWAAARGVLLHAFWAVLAPGGTPSVTECSLTIVNWLAGLTSAADWMASNPEWFPLGERGLDDLCVYHAEALSLADRALPALGWYPWRSLLDHPATVDALMVRMIGRHDAPPRALQRIGDELLQQARGPALLLVEAPMGEGKTELAFLAHLRLQAANQHRGLYLALPTQATGNALFERAKRFLGAFAQDQLDLQLVHGGAAMSEELAKLRGLGELRGVGDQPSDNLSANAWFGQRSRPLLSPNGVGTVDQALYAVLNVKHHFVRMWGLSNRVVVLDEVHAYDTFTSGLIDALLRWLKALGCSVVLMSATLPSARRRALLAAWGLGDEPPEVDYPRLLLADARGVTGRHVPARPLAPIRLEGLPSGLDEIAAAACRQLRDGGCGAAIVNTVHRAQSLYRLVQARLQADGMGDTVLLLFHARYPADQRQVLEAEVLRLFGLKSERPARALLVATQVAEQSLDIDFDFMVSDLAPVDLLLQRAGRLHRHHRPLRPAAHRVARLGVAGLLPDALPDMKGTAWGFVYSPYILGRTWALLTREAELQLPVDIDRLVQAVYDHGHELPADLDAAARAFIEGEAFGEHCAEVKWKRQQAANALIDPDQDPASAYGRHHGGRDAEDWEQGLVNVTRLTEPSVTLVPVLVGPDGRWHVREGGPGFDPAEVLTPDMARALYERHVKVSSKRVVAYFREQEPPVAFAEHGLLRHMYPLPLVGPCAADPDLDLRLDPELGLCSREEEGAEAPSFEAPRSGECADAASTAKHPDGSSPQSGELAM